MSSLSSTTSATAGARVTGTSPDAARDRTRRRAIRFTAAITAASVVLLIDLLLAGHTHGEEVWGPITAALASVTGGLSLVVLAIRGSNRAARWGLIALWLTVAFFGFGGYNDHRLPLPEGTVDSRPRPPLAPLMFTGMGIAGAINLRSGTKGN